MVTKQEGLEVGCSANANASTASIGRRMQWMQQWMLAWPGIRQSQSKQWAGWCHGAHAVVRSSGH